MTKCEIRSIEGTCWSNRAVILFIAQKLGGITLTLEEKDLSKLESDKN